MNTIKDYFNYLLFVVTSFLATAFVFILLSGWSLNSGVWLWPGIVFVFFMAPLTTFCWLWKPVHRKMWLINRLTLPIALAGLAELVTFIESPILNTTMISLVWLAIVIVSFLSLLELTLRFILWVVMESEEHGSWFKGLTEPVFAWMDRAYGRSVKIGVAKDDILELVVHPDECIVLEKVFNTARVTFDGLDWIFVMGLFIGIGLTLSATMYPILSNLPASLDREITIIWWPFPATLLVSGLIVYLVIFIKIAQSYFYAEWNRRWEVWAFYRKRIHIVHIEAPTGNVWISGGKTAALTEIWAGPPGEKPRQASPSFWGKIWDGFLYGGFRSGIPIVDQWLSDHIFGLGIVGEFIEGRRVMQIGLPVKEKGGGDIVDYAKCADILKVVIEWIAKMSQDASDEKGGAALTSGGVKFDPDRIRAEQGWVTVQTTIADDLNLIWQTYFMQVLAGYEHLSAGQIQSELNAGDQIVDIFILEDPHRWDLTTGKMYSELPTDRDLKTGRLITTEVTA